MDIKIKDNHGRYWQLSTIQIDFNLPERFSMEYIDENGEKQRPVMIHRAIAGSIERLIGIMLEHYSGILPLCIAPIQAALIPISNQSEKQMEYVCSLTKELKAIGIDLEIYDDYETFNKRIKNAEDMKIPLILIIGDEEADSKTINVRNKIEQRRYQISEKELLTYITKQMKKNI